MLRDDIQERLAVDLVGPYAEDETLQDYPSDIYLTGILYPQRSAVTAEQDETLGAEGASGGGDGEDTSRDEVGSNKRQRPSSFGVSFAVAAVDECGEQNAAKGEDGDTGCAGERREESADQRGHDGEAAGHPTDEGAEESDESLACLALGQDEAGQGEERDRWNGR